MRGSKVKRLRRDARALYVQVGALQRTFKSFFRKFKRDVQRRVF